MSLARRTIGIRMLALASVATFLVAVSGRPIVDPDCLEHHTGIGPGQTAASDSPHHRIDHGVTPFNGTSQSRGSGAPSMGMCLCWFSGMAVTPPSFVAAGDFAPARVAPSAPRTASLRPIPFVLPFANAPPIPS